MFNWLLSRRIEEHALNVLRIGDLAWVHRSRAVFLVDEDELANPDLPRRAAALELSPSGPMWGPKMTQARGEIAIAEEAILRERELSINDFERRDCPVRGERRPMRCRVTHPVVDGGFDEHGAFVRVAFDLDRGAYATIVLREVLMGGAKAGRNEDSNDDS